MLRLSVATGDRCPSISEQKIRGDREKWRGIYIYIPDAQCASRRSRIRRTPCARWGGGRGHKLSTPPDSITADHDFICRSRSVAWRAKHSGHTHSARGRGVEPVPGRRLATGCARIAGERPRRT